VKNSSPKATIWFDGFGDYFAILTQQVHMTDRQSKTVRT